MKIGHQKDFWGGTLFAVIGLLFALIARGLPGVSFMPGYSMGTPARMGPGFFPFYLGAILFVLGLVIAIGGGRGKKGGGSHVEKIYLGPIGYLLCAVVLVCLALQTVRVPLGR